MLSTMLQIKIYDAAEKTRSLVELPPGTCRGTHSRSAATSIPKAELDECRSYPPVVDRTARQHESDSIRIGSSRYGAQARDGAQMITIPELVAKTLGSFLSLETKNIFASSHTRLTELLPYAARLALECIGNSDALYHDIEHSMLVTLAGHDILMGRETIMRISSWHASPTTSDTFVESFREMSMGPTSRMSLSYNSSAARIFRCRARSVSCGPLKVVRPRAPRLGRRP
jgi:hypothetical protein